MVDSLGSVASPTDKLLILEPKIFKNVYENSCENLFTFSVYCKNNKRFLLCQNHKFMCLYNLKGNVQKSIQPNQGMTHGTLQWQQVVIYNDRSVNIVKSSQIHTLIKLRRWIPHNICSTSAGDLLVIVESDDYEQTKVVHYAGSTEIRSIQLNDSGESLYSSGVTKYITENRNKDICVTDLDLHAVVVVNQAENSGLHTLVPLPVEWNHFILMASLQTVSVGFW